MSTPDANELLATLRSTQTELGAMRERLARYQEEIDEYGESLEAALEANADALEQGRDEELAYVMEFVKQLIVDRHRIIWTQKTETELYLLDNLLKMFERTIHRR